MSTINKLKNRWKKLEIWVHLFPTHYWQGLSLIRDASDLKQIFYALEVPWVAQKHGNLPQVSLLVSSNQLCSVHTIDATPMSHIALCLTPSQHLGVVHSQRTISSRDIILLLVKAHQNPSENDIMTARHGDMKAWIYNMKSNLNMYCYVFTNKTVH